MTDVTKPTLVDSKLYGLARGAHLLGELIPELTTQISVEVSLEDDFPRTQEDGDATRILINYTNSRGRSQLYKFTDTARLTTTFDIDDFLMNYGQEAAPPPPGVEPVEAMEYLLRTCLTYSVGSILSLMGEHNAPPQLAQQVVSAIVAIVYDDPYDVVIAIADGVHKETGEVIPTITAAWIVKTRKA